MSRIFDFQEEEDILIEKANTRKEEEYWKKFYKEKRFADRNEILKQYFIRMSSFKKTKFLMMLLDNVRSEKTISELANFLTIGDAKANIYIAVDPQTYKYNKLETDHDRMLEERALKQAMCNDLEWFKSLDGDNQVDIILGLVKLSSSNIRRNVTFRVFRMHYRPVDADLDNKPSKSGIEFDIESRMSVSINPEDSRTDLHPATIEVVNLRKNWHEIISKYREKVHGKLPVAKEMKGKDNDDKNKNMNKDQEDKSTQKKGKKKNGGKSKADSAKAVKTVTGENSNGIDWIQYLPIWTVKQIFSYFDQKTLEKVKAVNFYWANTVQDVIKERKVRQQLNKEIAKAKSEIDPVALEKALKCEVVEEKRHKLPKRLSKYKGRAVARELIPPTTNTLEKASLIAETMREMTLDYFQENIVSFPREIKDEEQLHKYEPCFIKDVNVVLGNEQDAEKRKPFSTYSLPTKSSSLSISADRETIDQW